MATTDRRPYLVRSFALGADIVAEVRKDQLGDPTPCPDYPVAALVDHLVGAGWRAVSLGRGESPSSVEEFPHTELADAPDELRRAGIEAEVAWADDARLAATVTMPWGETYNGETLVNMYLAELAAHTWDLAITTGQRDRLDPELAPNALDAAHAMLKPDYRDAMGEGNPFGAEVEARPDFSDWERFAAFMGREPR